MSEAETPDTACIRAEFDMRYQLNTGECTAELTLVMTDPQGMVLPPELFCPTLRSIQQVCQRMIDRHNQITQQETPE